MKKSDPVRRDSQRRARGVTSDPFDTSALSPVRARRSLQKGDKLEDESDEFLRRAEWWRFYHGDASGIVSGELRRQAITHAEKMALEGLDNVDPGGAQPRNGFELIQPRAPRGTRIVMRGLPGRNPRPHSSFGFVSEPVEVHAPLDLKGVVLKIRLDPVRLRQVEATTVRVFSLDGTSGEWQLIPRSGARAEACYAWAHLERPGLYVAVGLPSGADRISALLQLRGLMPRLRATETEAARRQVLTLIGELLSSGQGRQAAVRATGSLDIGNLDVRGRGLPEFDILDEISPPVSPGNMVGQEMIQRIRWDDIEVSVGNLDSFQYWLSVGPSNVSGRIKSLQIHPVEGNGVLAGAADGGVWRTQDGGRTWLPLMSQELSMSIGAVARSSADLSVIYAATGEDTPGYGPSFPGVGVYKSADGGNSWTLLPPIYSTRCTRVLLHPTNVNVLFVAGSSGLHKSIDGGASWTNVRNDHVSDAVMDPVHPDTIYAAVWNSGIFRTRDGGASWSDFNKGLPTGAGADWIKIAASEPAGDGSVTLVAKMGTDSGMVFKCRVPPVIGSRARRPPFNRHDFDPPWQLLPGVHESAVYNEWTDLVAIDPKRQNVIFAGAIGLQRSTDGGNNFSQVTGTHDDHHALAFDRFDTDLCYMASDGGVYRSVDNGATWTLNSTGLVATQLYSIGVSQSNPFLLGGATQDQGIIKTNGPADWTDTHAGNEGGFFIVDPNNGKNVYVTPWSGNLRRSTDGGENWQTILNGITLTGTMPQAVTIRHLAVCPSDSNLLLSVGGNEVFRSVDQGNSWTSVLTISNGFSTRVAWMEKNTCYAASASGQVFRSTQQGAAGTWSQPYSDTNKPPVGTITALQSRFVTLDILTGKSTETARRTARSTAPVSAIISFPFQFDLVYIAYSFGGRVFKSTDGGAQWVNASGSGAGALPNIAVNALVIDNHLSDTVYVATDIGVFRTRDGGANWQPFNENLPRVVVSDLALRSSNNNLYCSTMGRGAYQRVLSS